MAHLVKSTTRLIELETGKEWQVERRTRGKDGDSGDPGRPIQTWIIILKNALGHKQFVPEGRLWTLYAPFEAPKPETAPETASLALDESGH